MNNYAKTLRASSKTWSSAYLQFKTGKDREGYRAYSFVEDDDDKWFYQKALDGFRGISYVSCGGKDQVLAVYKKLKSEGSADNNLFFVDRDTETLPTDNSEDVLRTEMYSWESYVCQPDYVGYYLEMHIDPNLSPKDVVKVIESWKATLERFRNLLAEHAAFCRTAVAEKKSLGLGEYRVRTPLRETDLVIAPHQDEETLPVNYFNRALSEGCDEVSIRRRIGIFLALEPYKYHQGKLVFSILKHFVSNVLKTAGRQIRGMYNSPVEWVKVMPSAREELNFIRTYAEGRLPKIAEGSSNSTPA